MLYYRERSAVQEIPSLSRQGSPAILNGLKYIFAGGGSGLHGTEGV